MRESPEGARHGGRAERDAIEWHERNDWARRRCTALSGLSVRDGNRTQGGALRLSPRRSALGWFVNAPIGADTAPCPGLVC
jgi:hypothetical protein